MSKPEIPEDFETDSERSVYCVGAAADLCEELRTLLKPVGVNLTCLARPEDLRTRGAEPPAVLVLDLACLCGPSATAESVLAEAFRADREPPALLCIGGADDMKTRLRVMRAGAQGFFPAPVSAGKLAQKVAQLAGLGSGKRHRILVVEDDPAQAKFTAAMLAGAGMEARVVADPLKVLDAMNSFRPHLVLMDLYLPGASGAELTAIIRDHDEHYDTPIVFLSAEEDLDKQLDALRVGADSFIAKPVHRKALIGTIEHRIRMRRWLAERREAAARPATRPVGGLVGEDSLMREAERALRGVQAQDAAHSATKIGNGLILVDLDHQRWMLDRLGIVQSEQLLRQVEAAILRSVTDAESAARLGDFAYGVLAVRADGQELLALAQVLCDALACIPIPAEGGPSSHLAASVGVAALTPPADDAIALLARARRAVATARLAGGGRVARWEPAVPAEPESQADERMRTLIEEALVGDGFKLRFQPVVAVAQDSIALHEVQLRLVTPEGDLVSPTGFLPIAERWGLMGEVDRWVLGKALDLLRDERPAHPRLRLLVHQSLGAAATRDWLNWFRESIVARDLMRTPPVLQFQLEDVMRNRVLAQVLFGALGKLGVRLCVANCSGAPAELDVLKLLGVSLAKLSFEVLTKSGEAELGEILKSLRERGIASIAAGIEDPATIARVWACRPDYIQGNFLQMPSSEIGFFELDQHSESL